jgi:RimJ/RimL family protein N-acetyltransferase
MIVSKVENLKCILEALPQVVSIGNIEIVNNIIKYISIKTQSAGRLVAQQIDEQDAPDLFKFYFEGLSEKPRRLLAPYPLFNTPPSSIGELAKRIKDWEKEHDWTAINLKKDGNIIGFCLLKRYFKKQATSGIAIRDDFLKLGLGYLLQNIIIEQARILKLKKFHVKIVSDNMASIRLHEKCGFRFTRVLPPTLYEELLKYLNECDIRNGIKPKDRRIIEMVIELDDGRSQ